MRTIDADALSKQIHEEWFEVDADKFDEYFLSKQPTVEVNNWISVKDRLPEYGQDVLVQLECKRIRYLVDNRQIEYDVAERVDFKHPQFDADYYWKGRVAYNPSDIIAWQPLPEPYESEGK